MIYPYQARGPLDLYYLFTVAKYVFDCCKNAKYAVIQTRRLGAVPSLPDGHPVDDPVDQTQRRRLQGRLHQMALHDHPHRG